MGPLPIVGDANPSPVTGIAPADSVTLGARPLGLTADSKGAAFAAITQRPRLPGAPYERLQRQVGARPDLRGVVRRHSPAATTGLSSTAASWRADCRARCPRTNGRRWRPTRRASACGARSCTPARPRRTAWRSRATVDAKAEPGLRSPARPLAGACSWGRNCNGPVVIGDGWLLMAASPPTVPRRPLLVDAAGNAYAANTTYPDGRQACPDVRAVTGGAAHAHPGLRRAELGDARPVHRRASRLRLAPGRRLLPSQRPSTRAAPIA